MSDASNRRTEQSLRAAHSSDERYSLLQRLHYRFNWNVDRVLVHLQRDCEQMQPPAAPGGLVLREIDASSRQDSMMWAQMINSAYPDAAATPEMLATYWQQHPLLNLQKVLVAFDGSHPIGTVSGGAYHANPAVGGAARVAVVPDYQHKGVATWMLGTVLSQGPHWGFERAEGVAMVSRVQSIRVLLRLGLRLQEDWSQVIPTKQRRRWPARDLALRRARAISDRFFADHPECR